MTATRTSTPPRGPRGALVRFAEGPDGRVRGLRLALLAAVLAVLSVIGGLAAFVAAGGGSPEVLGYWLVGSFLVVKLPFLALVWWLLGRHLERPGANVWTAAERAEILAHLDARAVSALERPDASARLAYLSAEAWNVVDSAPDAEKPDALTVALRIDALAARARAARHG